MMQILTYDRISVLKYFDIHSRRYRTTYTVGLIAGSCLIAAAPVLASFTLAACLIALDVIEVWSLLK
mgnify:CR=1 FL=1